METTPQQAPIPLEQAIIPFHGSQILAVRLPDNRVASTLNSLCTMLGIHPESQVRHIRKNKDLAEHLLPAQVETTGGLQRMAVLIAEAIPFWVVRLRFDQIAPEKREFIIFLKMEAVEALYGYFYKGDAGQTMRPPPEPQVESPVRPIRQKTDTASDLLLERLFDVLRDMRQEERAKREELERSQRGLAEQLVMVKEWLTSLDRRMAATSQTSTAGPVWQPLLSRTLFHLMERATGRTPTQLEQEMLETFRVPAITVIPDEQWQDILDWCVWRVRNHAQ